MRRARVMAWVFLVLLGAATWIDASRFHRQTHADAIVPVLMSLQHWTPFYWGQDRFGMIGALLAIPVRSPFANLLVQNLINIFCGLAALVLATRWLYPGPRAAVAGLLTAAAFIVVVPEPIRFDFFGLAQPYAPSLALAFAGLILLEDSSWSGLVRPRGIAAVALLVLAHWVNITVGAPLLLFLALRSLLELRAGWKELLGRTGISIAALALATGAGFLMRRLSRLYGQTNLGRLRMADWPSAWAQFARVFLAGEGDWPKWAAAALGLGLAATFLLGPRQRARTAIAAIGAAGIFWLFLGQTRWVAVSEFNPRYALPVIVLAHAASFGVLLSAPRREPSRAGLAVVSCLLLATIGLSYGAPSFSRVRADFDGFGRLTEDLIASGATHLVGDYWIVWPACLHAQMTWHERGVEREVWGLSFRSDGLAPAWKRQPRERFRIAASRTEKGSEVAAYLALNGFGDFQKIEERPTLVILAAPVQPAPRAAGP